ncbi:SUKH-3 domain-containing protein [Streptomyces sp. NPDC014636]|uniref:SUKH-3 domain-containing protein n=1 Tax=Streptomyces sp. NPDC014636 TaxID=3364876 RepID=UPI003701CC2E
MPRGIENRHNAWTQRPAQLPRAGRGPARAARAGDGGTILMDEAGRFFPLHHSGEYFLGSDKYSALMRHSRGYPLEHPEDYSA